MIPIAKGLDLPDDVTTQVLAFMGRRGSGKTYAAGRLAEQLLEHERQVVVLDPVGVWWGLRLAADGKRPGFSIPVFGGQHADMPLPHTAGKLVAAVLAERQASAVLDVSDLTGGEQRRFVAEFCGEFLHAKRRHRSPVMVILEEAQEFCPQHVRGPLAQMVGAVEKLVKLGRNFGIGSCLVSQRPQAVNKEILNQTEALFAMQLTGPQERKAIEGWVQEKGAGERNDLALELPGLPVGTAMVWSPQWLQIYGRYQILKKATFNASATPVTGKGEAAVKAAPLDLAELRSALEAAGVAPSDDVEALKAEVVRLRRELAAVQAHPLVERVEVPTAPPELAEWAATLQAVATCLSNWPARLPRQPAAPRVPVAPAKTAATRAAPSGAAVSLPRGARDMLAALASRHPAALTRTQVATLARMGVKGGTFAKYLSILRGQDLVMVEGSVVSLTPAGFAAAGPVQQPRTGQELLEMWRPRLPGKAKEMLEYLASSARPVSRSQLAKAVNIEDGGGTFAKYLSILRTNALVEKTGDGFQASDALRG